MALMTPEIERLLETAESGEDWAEICRLEELEGRRQAMAYWGAVAVVWLILVSTAGIIAAVMVP